MTFNNYFPSCFWESNGNIFQTYNRFCWMAFLGSSRKSAGRLFIHWPLRYEFLRPQIDEKYDLPVKGTYDCPNMCLLLGWFWIILSRCQLSGCSMSRNKCQIKWLRKPLVALLKVMKVFWNVSASLVSTSIKIYTINLVGSVVSGGTETRQVSLDICGIRVNSWF